MIIQIVPNLPPVVCGVGDYAAMVGAELAQARPSLYSAFVACGWRAEVQPEETAGLRNITGACDPTRLWRAIEGLVDERRCDPGAVALILQYSGYGYDPSGAPAWLAEALERRPRRFAASKIVTMFHELYATGPIWRRSFWTSRSQRGTTIRIARRSDGMMTNRQESAHWLEVSTNRAAGKVTNLPVPSNVGEPEAAPPWHDRQSRAIVFGGAANKRVLFSRRAPHVAEMLARVGVKELLDVGERVPVRRDAFERRGIVVEQLGFCQREQLGVLLAQSRIGLLDYPWRFIDKSSAFAAYAAHGVAPVLAGSRGAAGEGDGPPALALAELANSRRPADLCAAASARVRPWYDEHRLAAHARTLLALGALA
jgi:hypothetical protein